MKERGITGRINQEDAELFCKNSLLLEVTRMRSPEEELKNPNYDDLMNEFFDPDSSVTWYVATRAVEQFRQTERRYPGEKDDQRVADTARINEIAGEIMKKMFPEGN